MKAGGIELKGEWSYEAVTVADYGVTYSWSNAPTGEYTQTLPADSKRYVPGQPYDVDATFTSETVVCSQDEYGNNNGKWTFSGWTVVNNGVMPEEDVVLEGTWSYEELTVATGKVTYSWTGEPTGEYAQVLPTDDTEYFIGQTYEVDETFVNGTTVEHKDAYGNVDGRWTFGGWSVAAEEIPAETMSADVVAATGVMVEGGILLTGDWTYEAVEIQTYTVTYYVDGELYGEVETYVYNQPVNALRANPERSGYTFSGWDVTELPELMPAYNIEVYGTFKKNATPTPNPTPVPTPVPGDDPEPTPEPVIIIEDEPVPMTDQPVPTDDQQVLGARRGNDQAVLGARRGTEYAVLGKRRRPETGDSMEMIVWLITLGMSMTTALVAVMMMQQGGAGKKNNE